MQKHLTLAAALLLTGPVIGTTSQAANLRPITHEDVWLAKRISSPKVSPDGRRIVFQVTEPAYDDKEKAADLWIVPADGSAPAQRLTNSRGTESDVAWSEDGARIVFSTKRE
ncbi:MAG: hypothetical protein U1F31_16170, partial [Steroidobacteraceae bacterium]